MKARFSRRQLRRRIGEALSDPAVFGGVTVPDTIVDWLNRLALLKGVPLNYLVPDERMLPPESIRFFYLNPSWIDALVDGAMSIGRNLSVATAAGLPAVEHVAVAAALAAFRANAGRMRARKLGVATATVASNLVSGFLLRSSVVRDFPGLGVNAYSQGGDAGTPLTILRLEQLGSQSDTMICLVDGDAQRFDLHEAPEALHFGLDSFDPGTTPVTATKTVWTFAPGPPLDITGSVPLAGVSGCLRSAQPRSMMMTAFQQAINIATGNPITSAEMGFEMTLGVAQVSFVKRGPA
ncbi:MAG: hypothetical protein WDM91_11595 [Rhizomicrobium sp.]